MSFQNESLVTASVAAGDPTFVDSSVTEAKQSHQWLVDPVGPQSFSSEEQDIQPLSSQRISGISSSDVPPWEGVADFRAVQSQCLDKLFGPENMHSMDFNGGKGDRFGDDHDIAVGLSIAQCGENSETGLSFNGMKKLKVDLAGDSRGGICMPRATPLDEVNSPSFPGVLADSRANETVFASMGSAWKENVTASSFLTRDYEEQIQFRPVYSTYDNETVSIVSVSDPYKGEVNELSFGGYDREEGSTIPVGRLLCRLDESYSQLSQIKKGDGENLLDMDAPVANVPRVVTPRSNYARKNKPELKSLKKESPNNFPSNVRNLICTGILDGVPVKYISSSREELRGMIKGSGYLCGCQSCDFTKVLSAFEFERHAGCKTKHPNNRIFFENGRTIYQIVQELRSTPEDMLFEAVQTVFGATINQKSFRVWKESYLAATRELQRIYGKEINE